MSLVYVLLFNARTDNEGIHTLQEGSRNKVLMFEDEDDATRFALMLEAQDFPPVTVEAMEQEEIVEFCRGANYEWDLVEPGKLAVPPEHNVTDTDWNEEGHYVAEEKVEETPEPAEAESLSPEEAAKQAELDRIRQQLEGLL